MFCSNTILLLLDNKCKGKSNNKLSMLGSPSKMIAYLQFNFENSYFPHKTLSYLSVFGLKLKKRIDGIYKKVRNNIEKVIGNVRVLFRNVRIYMVNEETNIKCMIKMQRENNRVNYLEIIGWFSKMFLFIKKRNF